jgi:hypothetical protein
MCAGLFKSFKRKILLIIVISFLLSHMYGTWISVVHHKLPSFIGRTLYYERNIIAPQLPSIDVQYKRDKVVTELELISKVETHPVWTEKSLRGESC